MENSSSCLIILPCHPTCQPPLHHSCHPASKKGVKKQVPTGTRFCLFREPSREHPISKALIGIIPMNNDTQFWLLLESQYNACVSTSNRLVPLKVQGSCVTRVPWFTGYPTFLALDSIIFIGAVRYGKCKKSKTLSEKIDDLCEEYFPSSSTTTGDTPSEKCR